LTAVLIAAVPVTLVLMRLLFRRRPVQHAEFVQARWMLAPKVAAQSDSGRQALALGQGSRTQVALALQVRGPTGPARAPPPALAAATSAATSVDLMLASLAALGPDRQASRSALGQQPDVRAGP